MTNLKCPFNHELLSTYASGNGSAQDRSVVERHLANCGHCRREVLELEKSWWALDVWRDEDIPVHPRFDVLKNRIQASREPISLVQRAKPYWHQASRVLTKSSKFAAAAAVAAFMMVAAFHGGQSTMTNPGVNSRLAVDDESKMQSAPKLVEFAPQASDPLEASLRKNAEDLERLQTFVAFGDRNQGIRTEGGFTPRRVVPANNDVVAISYHPTALNDGVYLGQ